MTRLTNKVAPGEWNVLGIPWKEVDQRLYGALCKLKDYEDTGLSPADVERVNDFDTSQAIQAVKELQAEQRKHQWIPVSERLPEPLEAVLVCYDSGKIDMDWWDWDGDYSYHCFGQALAWMPLPVVYVDEL